MKPAALVGTGIYKYHAACAFYLSAKQQTQKKYLEDYWFPLGLFLVIVIAGIPLIKFLPAQLEAGEERILGKADVTLDMNGWKQFFYKFDSLYKSDISTGAMKENALIISDYWFPAAHLDYYIAQPLHIQLMAVGKLTDIHHYAWLNKERPDCLKVWMHILYIPLTIMDHADSTEKLF